MKINIQKIAYRVIPFVVALVIAFSAIVVGEPIKASAAYDYGDFRIDSNRSPINNYADNGYFELEFAPRFTTASNMTFSDAVTHSFASMPYMTCHKEMYFRHEFTNKFYRNDDEFGNTVCFVLNFRIEQQDGGTFERFNNTIYLQFYDKNGNYLSGKDLKIYGEADYVHGQPEYYEGTLTWPVGASYFKPYLYMNYTFSDTSSKVRYYYPSQVSENGLGAYLLTYNMMSMYELYTGTRVYWNRPCNGEEYTSFCYDQTWDGCSWCVEKNGVENWYENGSVTIEHNSNYVTKIWHCPQVFFDINLARFIDGKVYYRMTQSWVANDNTMDTDIVNSAPYLCIFYYDANSKYIGKQWVEMANAGYFDGVGSTYSSQNCRFEFIFDFPDNAAYLTFGVYHTVSADGPIAFLYQNEEFNFLFTRYSEEAFSAFLSGDYFGGDVVLPPTKAPDVYADDFQLGDIFNGDAFKSYVEPIKTLWKCDVVLTMLICVVTLCMVSWVFFGQKGG